MNVLVSVKTKEDPSLKTIINDLKSYNINFDIATPPEAYHYLKKRDFIIALGGDGTVLGTSRLMKISVNSDTPLLTVRSNHRSIGALCYYPSDRAGAAINQIKKGEYTIEKWTRVKATCNGSTISGLNEIYIGSEFSVRASKYNLHFNHKSDYQISSGVVVSTGTGSTGWFKSILGTDPIEDRQSPDLAFIVRELSWHARIDSDSDGNYYPPVTCDIITTTDSFSIEWLQDRHGVAAADGSFKSAFAVARGNKVIVENAHDPVNVIKCLP